jgi:SOS response regulatory protein OraA/RecX
MQRLFHSNQELRRKLEERKVALAKAEEAITELKRQLDDVGAKHVEAEAKVGQCDALVVAG